MHNLCLRLGRLLYPGEIGSNGYAIFFFGAGGWGGGGHKVHYGLCESGESPLGEHGPITREMVTFFIIRIKIGNLMKLTR